ncbi:Uncharacterised protein [Citrobacter freundii]|nr:Uncharacterised protein [Citrobacter freundii]
MYSRQRRRHIARQLDIIITHHRHILRNAQSRLVQSLIRANRHCIIAGKNGLRSLFMRQQRLHSFKAATKLKVTGNLVAFRDRQARPLHCRPISFQTQTRRGFIQRPGDAGNARKTFFDKMLRG